MITRKDSFSICSILQINFVNTLCCMAGSILSVNCAHLSVMLSDGLELREESDAFDLVYDNRCMDWLTWY